MKTISTYISTINSLFYQSTLEQTIRQSLLFSDEICVSNSINSSDGTQNLLLDLQDEFGKDKLKIFIYDEPKIDEITKEEGRQLLIDRKTFALMKCKSDYCILQDDDEMIHETYIDIVRNLPNRYPDSLGFRFNVLHFYRSYNMYQNNQNKWYQKKIYMIKNKNNIRHGDCNGDLDNFIICQNNNHNNQNIPLDNLQYPKIVDTPVTCYHYGWANRNDAIFMIKRYYQEIQWNGKSYWDKNKIPFKFESYDNLVKYNGTHPKYMVPIIEKEMKYNSKHIGEFTNSEFTDSEFNCQPHNIPTLSACLVVRNEEKNIRNCLDNIKDLVDEIVVVDGFSTDNTVSICKEYTNKVYIRQPEGYCEPDRNYTIEKATGDWILIIDPDETLEPSLCNILCKPRVLLKYCEQKGFDIIALKRKNYIDGVFMDDERSYPDCQFRIFKNNGKIKYTGKIHESPIRFTQKLSSDYHIIHKKTKEEQELQNKRYKEIYKKYNIEDVWS